MAGGVGAAAAAAEPQGKKERGNGLVNVSYLRAHIYIRNICMHYIDIYTD